MYAFICICMCASTNKLHIFYNTFQIAISAANADAAPHATLALDLRLSLQEYQPRRNTLQKLKINLQQKRITYREMSNKSKKVVN